ncbi:MAG: 50S ribosomal protein L22 [Candidatus Anstonellales archaeon]
MEMYNSFDSKTHGKARLEDVDVSFKDAVAVCRSIKGMETEKAIEYLEAVKEMKKAVKYTKYNKKMAHRKELGGQKGRYPRKAGRIVLKVLKDAIANAESKGITGELEIVHASANKKNVFRRIQPKGRQIYSNYETARIEIVVREKK